MSAIDNIQDSIRRSRNEPNTENDAVQEENSQLDLESHYSSNEDDNDPLCGFQILAK